MRPSLGYEPSDLPLVHSASRSRWTRTTDLLLMRELPYLLGHGTKYYLFPANWASGNPRGVAPVGIEPTSQVLQTSANPSQLKSQQDE